MTNALIEILHHKPNAYGINRSNWTLQSLADAYEKQYGQRIRQYGWQALKGSGLQPEEVPKGLDKPRSRISRKGRIGVGHTPFAEGR